MGLGLVCRRCGAGAGERTRTEGRYRGEVGIGSEPGEGSVHSWGRGCAGRGGPGEEVRSSAAGGGSARVRGPGAERRGRADPAAAGSPQAARSPGHRRPRRSFPGRLRGLPPEKRSALRPGRAGTQTLAARPSRRPGLPSARLARPLGGPKYRKRRPGGPDPPAAATAAPGPRRPCSPDRPGAPSRHGPAGHAQCASRNPALLGPGPQLRVFEAAAGAPGRGGWETVGSLFRAPPSAGCGLPHRKMRANQRRGRGLGRHALPLGLLRVISRNSVRRGERGAGGEGLRSREEGEHARRRGAPGVSEARKRPPLGICRPPSPGSAARDLTSPNSDVSSKKLET